MSKPNRFLAEAIKRTARKLRTIPISSLIAGLEEQRQFLEKEIIKVFPHYKEKPEKIAELIQQISETDPVSARTNGKRTPYIKAITKWVANKSLRLPEDGPLMNESLKKYHYFKHERGMNLTDPKDCAKSSDFLEKLDTVLASLDKETPIEQANRYVGLPVVWRNKDVKVYEISDSTTWEVAEKALSGTGWCVGDETGFGGMHSKPWYLAVSGPDEHREALMSFVHPQCKALYNRKMTNARVIQALVPFVTTQLQVHKIEKFTGDFAVFCPEDQLHLLNRSDLINRAPSLSKPVNDQARQILVSYIVDPSKRRPLRILASLLAYCLNTNDLELLPSAKNAALTRAKPNQISKFLRYLVGFLNKGQPFVSSLIVDYLGSSQFSIVDIPFIVRYQAMAKDPQLEQAIKQLREIEPYQFIFESRKATQPAPFVENIAKPKLQQLVEEGRVPSTHVVNGYTAYLASTRQACPEWFLKAIVTSPNTLNYALIKKLIHKDQVPKLLLQSSANLLLIVRYARTIQARLSKSIEAKLVTDPKACQHYLRWGLFNGATTFSSD